MIGAAASISHVKVSASVYPQAGYCTKPGLERSISRGDVAKISYSVVTGEVGGSRWVITQTRRSIDTVVKTISAGSETVL